MKNGFKTIASVTVGEPYGHVPGHQYHDVKVEVGRRGASYRAVALETRGSCQGDDEEHDRKKVVARSEGPYKALAEVMRRARVVGLDSSYLMQAGSQCEDELYEFLEVGEQK
jgi:hypothetical protein